MIAQRLASGFERAEQGVDAERALAQFESGANAAGGTRADLEIHLPGEEPGHAVRVSARSALAAAEEDAAAARELLDCVGGALP